MSPIKNLVSPDRISIPDTIQSWAKGIAELNVELCEEGLLLKSGYKATDRGTVSIYAGGAPIGSHVDISAEELGSRPLFPIWGFVLSCPEGQLQWDSGSAPIGTGSAYILDPSKQHSVSCANGAITFMATWGYDPEPIFGSIDAFSEACIALAKSLYDEEPDSTHFVERELGMIGELC